MRIIKPFMSVNSLQTTCYSYFNVIINIVLLYKQLTPCYKII